MHILRTQREKPVIARYKVDVKDLETFRRFLVIKSMLGQFEKDFFQMEIYENPNFADYYNLAKNEPNHFSWTKRNLSDNGFIIDNPEAKKELDVYVIESKKVFKKYNKNFGSSLKSLWYQCNDALKAKKQAKKLLKYYQVTYEKTSYDEIDTFRVSTYVMDFLTKKVGARFQKFLKNYNIKELKFDDKMYTTFFKNYKH